MKNLTKDEWRQVELTCAEGAAAWGQAALPSGSAMTVPLQL